MKAILTYILVIQFSSISSAQGDTSISGLWKIISIEVDGVYYNFKKDSISFSDEKKSLYTDDAKKKNLIEAMKMFYSAIEFHFEKNGILKQHIMGDVIPGSYKVNSSQNVIEMTSKNSLNEDVTDKVQYKIKNGLLFLSMKWGEDDEDFDLVLEKPGS